MINKFKIVIYIIFSIIIFTSCVPTDNCNQNHILDTNHLYYKDIEVEITDIDKRCYFSGCMHYLVYVTVYSKDYDLVQNFDLHTKDAYELEKGDIVKAELYSWKNNETGKINKRKINQIYYY